MLATTPPDLKFYEESEFDIFEAQGPSRDPLKRSRDQNMRFLISELETKVRPQFRPKIL